MTRTYLSLAVTLCLGALLMAFFPYRSLTPGTLRGGHQALQNHCLSCHTPFAGASSAKCAGCHKPGEIGLRSVKGDPLPKPNPVAPLIHRVVHGACDRCHSEHGGRFATKGTRRFSHDLLPADLVAGCAACHSRQKPADAIHAAVAMECSQCHGTKAWKPATYDHTRFFRFDANHPPRCADCHRAGAKPKEYSCTGCHEHSLPRMERKHREEGVANLEACRKCHPSGNERDTIDEGRPNRGREEEGD